MKETIESALLIVVGAMITVVPKLIEKYFDSKNKKKDQRQQKKTDTYLELIQLFGEVLYNLKYSDIDDKTINKLRNNINMINITGNIDVVSSLNEYINTWGKENEEIQNQKYTELIKTIRVDLEIDKKINDDYPEIGLVDIKVKNK